MYSVFLSSYRNTLESLAGELEKAVLVFPQHFSFSQTSTRVLNTVHVFYFLNICVYSSFVGFVGAFFPSARLLIRSPR